MKRREISITQFAKNRLEEIKAVGLGARRIGHSAEELVCGSWVSLKGILNG
jgi:hypothetical protein